MQRHRFDEVQEATIAESGYHFIDQAYPQHGLEHLERCGLQPGHRNTVIVTQGTNNRCASERLLGSFLKCPEIFISVSTCLSTRKLYKSQRPNPSELMHEKAARNMHENCKRLLSLLPVPVNPRPPTARPHPVCFASQCPDSAMSDV